MDRLYTHRIGRRAIPEPALTIGDHPVFQALPVEARQVVEQTGTLRRLCGGQVADHDALHFVLEGMLGHFPGAGGVCVSATVSGAVCGWDAALAPDRPKAEKRSLVETLLFSAPSAPVLDILGREWLVGLVAHQSIDRLRRVEEEAVCNASHPVTHRLAKWLLRLHRGSNGAPLKLTQSDLGAMIGVQRTSINAAASRLQRDGLVRFGRGKVEILSTRGLEDVSCRCGDRPSPAGTSVAGVRTMAGLERSPPSRPDAKDSGATSLAAQPAG